MENKFVLRKHSSQLVQKRLLSIQPTTERREVLKSIKRSPSIIIPTVVLLVGIITLMVVYSAMPYNDSGYASDGELSSSNITSFTQSGLIHVFGTDIAGRDNFMLQLNALVLMMIDVLIFTLFFLVFGTVLYVLFRRTNIIRYRFSRFSAIEGIVLMPLAFLGVSIFYKENYWAVMALVSIPSAIAFAYKLENNLGFYLLKTKLQESRMQNYFKTGIFFRVLFVSWLTAAIEIVFRSIILYAFWNVLFTYFGLIEYSFPHVINNSISIGKVLESGLTQVIENPLFIMFFSITLILASALLSIIDTSISMNKRKVEDVNIR